eukprot:5851784-Pyramimonas_sp.AAC.1
MIEWKRIDTRLKQQANVAEDNPQRGRFNYGFEDMVMNLQNLHVVQWGIGEPAREPRQGLVS